MKRPILILLFMCLYCGIGSRGAIAQQQVTVSEDSRQDDDNNSDDAAATISNGDNYLYIRIHKLEKYYRRASRIQHRLLKKLSKKEHSLAGTLAAKQPELYRQYLAGNVSYDSIMTLSGDTALLRNKGSPQDNKTIDSLKKIQDFLQKQSSKLHTITTIAGKAGIHTNYTSQLNDLQNRLNAQQAVQSLIQQQSNRLNNLLNANHIPGGTAITKDIAIARSKIQEWKALAADPDAAEAKALEYLQGIEGFEQSFKTTSPYTGLGANVTAADLQRMGYQTKSNTAALLQQQFGDNLGKVEQQMGQQIQDYTDKLNQVKEKVSAAREQVNEAKGTAANAKAMAAQAKSNLRIPKPAFKNPMRGIPFWKRWTVNYNFQTSRATPDSLRPAMATIGATAVFKHTPKISYGIGIAGSLGLGQDWQHLKLSYEGISARIYADCKLFYGFSLQAGYEKTLTPKGKNYINELQQDNNAKVMETALGILQDAAYIGIMKTYKINDKWNGTLLIGYNFLYQQSGLRSPFILRMGWEK